MDPLLLFSVVTSQLTSRADPAAIAATPLLQTRNGAGSKRLLSVMTSCTFWLGQRRSCSLSVWTYSNPTFMLLFPIYVHFRSNAQV